MATKKKTKKITKKTAKRSTKAKAAKGLPTLKAR